MIDIQIKLFNNNKDLSSYINRNKMFCPLLEYNIGKKNNNNINKVNELFNNLNI